MSTWCLIQSEVEKFKKALKDGSISPQVLAEMKDSATRREFLAKFVGEENAKQVNALYESKLLLKNQKAGMIAWAKSVAGLKPKVRQDILTKIERLQEALNPKEEEQFLNDLVSTRLGMDVTQEEAKAISDLSKEVSEKKLLADENGVFKNEEDRLSYGASKVALETLINDLKLQSRNVSFKEMPVRKTIDSIKEIPSVAKSLLSSLDNSFWGRQGIKVLANTRTSGIWIRNFLKSWKDIGLELGGINAIDLIKADIYSRPNALNGKYTAGGYGLDVLSEEAYPSSLPEKIPVLRRLFKASESAYNGAALRLRADLADRYIKIAEDQGINTLNKEEARGIGDLVGSLTGRGQISLTPEQAKTANALFFSIKFLKSNIDVATAHIFDKRATPFAKKEAAKNLANIILAQATILAIAKAINPDSVDEDPRSTNFGKIKIFGQWVDITGGMAALYTLAARIMPTQHDGEWGLWSKNKSGKWTKLSVSTYGARTAFDVAVDFVSGKLSPAAGIFRDYLKGQDFQGNPLTLGGVAKSLTIPLPIQNAMTILRDPNSSFVLGSLILDGLGFSTSASIVPNSQTNTIPEGKETKNSDLISYVATYAKAFGVDPETAFNRIFTGQRIKRVTNGTIIVERMPVGESQEIKSKLGGKNPSMKLDHTIPLQLGGSNDEGNLKLVTTSEWSSYTTVENALGKALKSKKIDKNKAQQLIKDFKDKKISKEKVLEEIK